MTAHHSPVRRLNAHYTPAQRFAHYTMPEPNSGCLLWLGNCTVAGYGVLRILKKVVYAHRFSWVHHFGEIPAGLHVCHKCDVPGCVNPNHLFLGTDADNLSDMRSKGRHNLGIKNGAAKLNEDAVRFIRANPSLSLASLARKFGVGHQTIGNVRLGLRWKHIS